MKTKRKRLKFSKFKKIDKPFIYVDEKYLELQRRLIVYGFPLLVTFLVYYYFTHPHLPLKSVMWSSALGSGSYFLLVSMLKPGTKTFWISFFGILTFNTMNIFYEFEYFGTVAIIFLLLIANYFLKDWQEIKSRKISSNTDNVKNVKLKIKKSN
ncbi:MAG: hypothetical protein MK132_14705 [Lentisphaerales bacterium]|nr:hypothetical protein [Lentisphaerales bacterium]